MLVCLRHMDKNKKPYGPNEVYVVSSLQKFVALVMNEKIGCTFRQLCEEYGIAGQDSPPQMFTQWRLKKLTIITVLNSRYQTKGKRVGDYFD